ncbi:hypothetical protein K450DRAFT_237051 [Umbelopsis ramanniana AG]|uniref:Uncharacterized protein n=1 Tax=Umbelopsis ramanniana AG TaxID=1314678 RepID=A0AAD5EBN2_UMBRA|nr:uncharacterized protein K450DRAFT_237051 [Umbelopsis ramanniana AG]KAI8580447.1 hypothetical protein K450DRAFT_237051 [Umbelopsis ramanniana AG]
MIAADAFAEKQSTDHVSHDVSTIEQLDIKENDQAASHSPQYKTIHFKASKATLNRRNTVSLADLIPAAAAALNTGTNSQVTSEASSLSRALTRVKTQMRTQRLKQSYLGKEWIRLALWLPVDESKINCWRKPLYLREKDEEEEVIIMEKSTHGHRNEVRLANRMGRTFEIATWYEWKRNPSLFGMEQVEKKVERLRSIKLDTLHADELSNNIE